MLATTGCWISFSVWYRCLLLGYLYPDTFIERPLFGMIWRLLCTTLTSQPFLRLKVSHLTFAPFKNVSSNRRNGAVESTLRFGWYLPLTWHQNDYNAKWRRSDICKPCSQVSRVLSCTDKWPESIYSMLWNFPHAGCDFSSGALSTSHLPIRAMRIESIVLGVIFLSWSISLMLAGLLQCNLSAKQSNLLLRTRRLTWDGTWCANLFDRYLHSRASSEADTGLMHFTTKQITDYILHTWLGYWVFQRLMPNHARNE